MGIEFNGNRDIRINNPDAGKIEKLPYITGGVKLDPAEIGNLLRSQGEPTIDLTENPEILDLAESLGLVKRHEPTPEELEARAQLDEKVSSTGISYKDANKKIDEIRDKYNDDKYYTEVLVEREQPRELMVYYPPIKQKVFDESKLPEPARTEYREAMEAKKEIENNNTALAKKAGITPQSKDEAPIASPEMPRIRELLEKLGGGTNVELTEKQKAAREKLDEKKSSTGVTYKDAKAKLAELKEKYEDLCTSWFNSKQPKNIALFIPPYEAFDPYKIPEPDKTAYFDALASIQEIEKANSALVAQGGLSKTPQPSQDYAKNPSSFDPSLFERY